MNPSSCYLLPDVSDNASIDKSFFFRSSITPKNFDFHQAERAGVNSSQCRMVTERRNINSLLPDYLKNGCSRLCGYFQAIDGDICRSRSFLAFFSFPDLLSLKNYMSNYNSISFLVMKLNVKSLCYSQNNVKKNRMPGMKS